MFRNPKPCCAYITSPRQGLAAIVKEIARLFRRELVENRQEQMRFGALGIETHDADLEGYILQQQASDSRIQVPPQLRESIGRYQSLADVVTLRKLQVQWPDYTWQRLIDRNTRQSFLAVFDTQRQLCLVANLHPRQFERVLSVPAGNKDPSRIREFIVSRAGLLEFEG